MTSANSKQDLTVLVQVKISRRAKDLLRRRAKRALRTQASYLRAIIYRDLGLLDAEKSG
jgi:hypothetical protein